MTTNSTEYLSCSRICCGELPAAAILCIQPNLLADGSNYLDVTIALETAVYGGCSTTWRYVFTYDNDLLVPGATLTSASITGVLCQNCLTNYIENFTVNFLKIGPLLNLAGAYYYVDNSDPHWNLFIGNDAPPSQITTGAGNLGIGLNALKDVTTGINNLAIGWDSQFQLTIGDNNVSVGEDAFKFLTDGSRNSGFGESAGYSTTSGSANVAVGVNSLYSNVAGSYNVAVGGAALFSTLSNGNVAVGDSALYNTTFGLNVAVGLNAGYTSTTGTGNVFLGAWAGFYETGDNKLFVDNQARIDEADTRLKSLMYGIFDALVVNQRLTVNAKLGVNTPATAWLHLPACAAGADLASAKIDSGILASVPVAGNIESDGTHLYWTNSAGIRKQLDN